MITKIECADKAVEQMSSLDLTILIVQCAILTVCISALAVILILTVRGE